MKIHVPVQPFDKLLELLGWIALVIVWVAAIVAYLELPDLIPIHYDLSGVITKYGNKITLLFFPITCTIILACVTWMNFHPELFNSGKSSSERLKQMQFIISVRLLRWLKVSIALVFLLVIIFIYFTTKGEHPGAGPWLIPVCLLLIMLPVVYYIFRLLTVK